MARRGKKYLEAAKLVDKSKLYTIDEALEIAQKASYAKFDETVELHFRLGVDPRHADQQVRGSVVLPHGLGKKIRVLVFTEGEGEKIAKEAGADYVGCDEYIKMIEEDGWLEFDVALATPNVMPKISRLGKILGRRGLMPNPKSGTLVPPAELPRAIEEAKRGRVEFRMDKTGVVHIPVGKLSFGKEKLAENIAAAIEAVVRAKPPAVKGQYIRSLTLATTMGPGIKLNLSAALSAAGIKTA